MKKFPFPFPLLQVGEFHILSEAHLLSFPAMASDSGCCFYYSDEKEAMAILIHYGSSIILPCTYGFAVTDAIEGQFGLKFHKNNQEIEFD